MSFEFHCKKYIGCEFAIVQQQRLVGKTACVDVVTKRKLAEVGSLILRCDI